jgi:hypothetical protein
MLSGERKHEIESYCYKQPDSCPATSGYTVQSMEIIRAKILPILYCYMTSPSLSFFCCPQTSTMTNSGKVSHLLRRKMGVMPQIEKGSQERPPQHVEEGFMRFSAYGHCHWIVTTTGTNEAQ